MQFNLDTQLGALIDHPQAKPIVEKYFPGLTTNPMVGMVKGMSINSLLSTPQAAQFGITKAKVETVIAEINKLVKK
jgi:hypothetical protein